MACYLALNIPPSEKWSLVEVNVSDETPPKVRVWKDGVYQDPKVIKMVDFQHD